MQRDIDCATDLREQVIGYYEYLWLRKQGVLLQKQYTELPFVFHAEVTHMTFKNMLKKVQYGFNNLITCICNVTVVHVCMMCPWAPAGIFPEGGKTAWTDKMTYFSARQRRERNILRLFRRFRVSLKVCGASA